MLSNRLHSRSLLLAGTSLALLTTCTEPTSGPAVASNTGADTDESSEGHTDGNAAVFSQSSTFTTLFKAPLGIEGLTADRDGNLYAGGRGGNPTCPIWRVPATGGAAVIVGTLAAPCGPAGLAFNHGGDLFTTDGSDKIFKLRPDAAAPPAGVLFASGVPGANGVAFDRDDNLWVSDGVTSQGRVWRIAPDGTVTEAFRVPPLANLVNAVPPPGGAPGVLQGGVGRDARALPPGTITITETSRPAADTAGSVGIVANGIAFSASGRTMFIADTARGAIWRVEIDRRGNLQSNIGCDTTYTPNTLCLDNVFVQHPALEGLDGIALDKLGNIWGVANERNEVVVVSPFGGVREVFRNPPDATTRLRNTGPLEFPTSPFLVGRTFCVTQSDGARRDNFPNSGGEVGPAPAAERAKLSCVDARLPFSGLDLPIR
ncbi:MAG TPA: SMP-30/gluconolactonase/LRE family protein [Kofleriaceae bacterium]